MEVRPGYKQTEVGIIPEDWDVKAVDEVSFVTSGKRLPLGSSLVDQPTPHPYIRVTDMRPGTIDLSEIRFVPESVFPTIKKYRIYQADIFISVAGTLGIVGKIPGELDGANLTENADRITNIKCVQDYLLYVLMSPLIQNTINSIQTIGAQPKLALERIRKFKIPLPPTNTEQRAIAAALSDVDALLDGLDRLIAKKRDLKQAAMQQLLTGQTRLPGFSGEWEVKKLGDLCGRITTGKLDANAMVADGDYPFFTCARENYWIDNYAFDCEALLVSGNGANVGYVHYYIGKFNAYQRTYVIGDFFADAHFLKLFLERNLSERIRVEVNAGNTPYITMGTLTEMEVFLPPSKSEQTAIATIVSDMDAEIAVLEARRDKTRALKQGMMQELLTGKTRLV